MVEPIATQIISAPGRAATLLVRQCKLTVTKGPDKGKEVTVAADTITIGTLRNNSLPLTDTAVSRNHLRVRLTDAGFVCEDLGSTNGTYIGQYKLGEITITDTATFQCGQTTIKFKPLKTMVEISLSERNSFGELIGQTVKMREIFSTLERIAPSLATVITIGESGTGKELVARALHQHSNRSEQPFVVYDCSAVPAQLAESEMFGHEKGAFTGAVGQRIGIFEAAEGGTLFLDEIGELPIEIQPKLLRVLEQREIRAVGANNRKKIDVRIVCATHRDLAEMVEQGTFREDLFYRLSVIQINLPNLRNRKDDIPLIVQHMATAFGADHVGDFFNETLLAEMQEHDWPGNVRELRNAVERCLIFGDRSAWRSKSRLSEKELEGALVFDAQSPMKDAKDILVQQFEREYLQQLLLRNQGNVSQSSREAEIERSYLQKLMNKHQLRTNPALEHLFKK